MNIRTQRYDTIRITLEGCKEEIEELSREYDYFVTLLPERVDDALDNLDALQEEESEWQQKS